MTQTMGGARSELELCSSPVSSFRIVSYFIISFISKPIRKRSVLFDFFSEFNFDNSCFVGAHLLIF